MKKQIMTIGKMLESIVMAVGSETGIDHINLVSTSEGEVITAKSSIELVVQAINVGWNLDWEVVVITAEKHENYFTVIFNPFVKAA